MFVWFEVGIFVWQLGSEVAVADVFGHGRDNVGLLGEGIGSDWLGFLLLLLKGQVDGK